LVGVSEAHDGDGDDRARADENVARLARTFGEAATLANVRALDGVDAKEWPNEGLKETIDALRSVFDVLSSGDAAKTNTKSKTKTKSKTNTPDLTLLKPLPWVEAVASREKKTGRLAKPWTDEAVAPSLGRLFSHMRAWQSAYDAGHEKAFFVENGALSGLRPSHLGVPLVAFPAIAKNAPEDFDLVVLNQPLFSGDDGGAFENVRRRVRERRGDPAVAPARRRGRGRVPVQRRVREESVYTRREARRGRAGRVVAGFDVRERLVRRKRRFRRVRRARRARARVALLQGGGRGVGREG
jgi:hypothetical protein